MFGCAARNSGISGDHACPFPMERLRAGSNLDTLSSRASYFKMRKLSQKEYENKITVSALQIIDNAYLHSFIKR